MFLDEARIASLVAHPNVASIVDTGEEAGTLYLAMEWVDGDSLQLLHRVLRKLARAPLGVVLRVVADACAGLHAVHEVRDRSGKLLDVVHRDMSPHNILVTPGEREAHRFRGREGTRIESARPRGET